MKRLLYVFVLFLITSMPTSVSAVCPVCTVAVAAGLGLSRYLGIDDLISGVWIGGLILSSSFWLSGWLERRKVKFRYQSLVVIALMYALVVLPLNFSGVIGHPFNIIWGIDRLLAGIISGSLVFLTAVWADRQVRKIKGHQLFIYQKVAFPLSGLVSTSLIYYQFFKI